MKISLLGRKLTNICIFFLSSRTYLAKPLVSSSDSISKTYECTYNRHVYTFCIFYELTNILCASEPYTFTVQENVAISISTQGIYGAMYSCYLNKSPSSTDAPPPIIMFTRNSHVPSCLILILSSNSAVVAEWLRLRAEGHMPRCTGLKPVTG